MATDQNGVVYVVDDEPRIRSSLALLLKSVGLSSTVFADATSFLAGHEAARAGCLVVDVRMPGMSGLELQEAMRQRGMDLPVIVITGHGDVAMAVRAMKAGAVDFIEKPFNDQIFIDAVQRALGLRKVRGAAPPTDRTEIERRIGILSPREREVMQLVVEGKPNKVVATRLGLSTRTVEVHRAKVMDKMQARSLAELVRMAIACDLIEA